MAGARSLSCFWNTIPCRSRILGEKTLRCAVMQASAPSDGGVPGSRLGLAAEGAGNKEAAAGLAPPLPKHVTKTMSKLAAGVGQESNLEIGFTIYSLTSIDPVEQTQWTQRTQRTQWNACSTGSMSYWVKPFKL